MRNPVICIQMHTVVSEESVCVPNYTLPRAEQLEMKN